MTERPLEGISISEAGDRVVIQVSAGRWEGSAAEAERILTALHYVIAKARPGTNIASLFLNDQLRGGKVIETDRRTAIREMRNVMDQLSRYVASLEEDVD